MIECFYSDLKTIQRCRSGPLGPQLEQFATLLEQTGYSHLAGQDKMRVVAQLNRWLGDQRLKLCQLSEERVRAFQTYQRKRRSSHHGEKATLSLFLQMLRQADLIPAAPERLANNPTDHLVQDYSQFLLQERALNQTMKRFVILCFCLRS